MIFEFSWYFTEGVGDCYDLHEYASSDCNEDCYDLQYASFDCNEDNTNIGTPICGTDVMGDLVTYTDECNIAYITWENSCVEASLRLLYFIHDGPCDDNELTEGKQNQHLLK